MTVPQLPSSPAERDPWNAGDTADRERVAEIDGDRQRPSVPWRGSIRHVGKDPDYRFTLANERTFLAYVRTSLALLAAGVAVVKLVPSFGIAGGRHVLSILLIALSMATAVSSYRRWRAAEVTLRLDRPLPNPYLPRVLAGGMAVVSIISLVLVLTSV